MRLLIENMNIKISILLFILAFSAAATILAQNEKPNILFIMSDDHTSQAWGIYGGTLKDYVHTPNISRLADEGTVLDNCLVSNSICTPSRATILTGQYSHINGITTLGAGLSPKQGNIAKQLQKGGYQTSVIGKWHLKKEPAGFDYYSVLPGQGNYWNPFSTDIIADKVIDWIDKRDKTKPFMAMCHFKATHEPFDYPDRFKDLYKDIEIPTPDSFYDQGATSTGRSFEGQSIDNLQQRYLTATNNPEDRKPYMYYPGLPFSIDGLNASEARKQNWQRIPL